MPPMTEPLKHYYQDNTRFGKEYWSYFLRLYHDMVAAAPDDEPSIFVEVGCYKGRSAAYLGVEIINSGKPIDLYVVDTFRGSSEHTAEERQGIYEAFIANMEPVTDILGERVRVYCMPSLDAAARLQDTPLDFVFLDASHELRDVLDDIQAWRPLVKPGGSLGGDDWKFAAVKMAVEREFGKGRVQLPTNAVWPWWRWIKPT